tara:strand:- start:285 stop:815 length:531 start_codon:yes stop_codon:yes gene_type:complete
MVIQFNASGKEPYNGLSNFEEVDIEYEGKVYASVEHCFQAQRYGEEDKKRFTKEGDLGTWEGFEKVSKKSDEYWRKKRNIGIIAKMATNKENVLGLKREYEIKDGYELWEPMLKEKFKDERLRKILMDTKEEELVEFDRFANTRGSYWGGSVIDGKIVGTNTMGKYIMRVRKEIST